MIPGLMTCIFIGSVVTLFLGGTTIVVIKFWYPQYDIFKLEYVWPKGNYGTCLSIKVDVFSRLRLFHFSGIEDKSTPTPPLNVTVPKLITDRQRLEKVDFHGHFVSKSGFKNSTLPKWKSKLEPDFKRFKSKHFVHNLSFEIC